MPEVSVVVPAYNASSSICKTLNSVIQQSFSDLEIIVVNDGSTDNTATQVARIHDSRLRLISKENGGVSSARNFGIDNACGNYVAFLDSDDIWLSDKLERQLLALKESEVAKVAYSWVDLINDDDQVIGRGSHSCLSGNVYPDLLVTNFIENGSNVLVERQALTSVGYFDTNFSGPEDRDMWLRLAARYEFVAVPKVHVLYRQSVGSLSANVAKQIKSAKQVIHLAYERAPEDLQHLKKSSLYNLYIYSACRAYQQNSRKATVQGLSYYLTAVYYNPALLLKGISGKIFLKTIVTLIVFPNILRLYCLNKLAKALNTSTLLGYVKNAPVKRIV